MKSITNDSLQRLEVYFSTNIGTKRRWIKPKQTLVVPATYISKQVKTLSDRRMISIRNA